MGYGIYIVGTGQIHYIHISECRDSEKTSNKTLRHSSCMQHERSRVMVRSWFKFSWRLLAILLRTPTAHKTTTVCTQLVLRESRLIYTITVRTGAVPVVPESRINDNIKRFKTHWIYGVHISIYLGSTYIHSHSTYQLTKTVVHTVCNQPYQSRLSLYTYINDRSIIPSQQNRTRIKSTYCLQLLTISR